MAGRQQAMTAGPVRGQAPQQQARVAKQRWAFEVGPELEGLPEIYRELVAVVGLEGSLRLARYLGGTHQYFPKFERIQLAGRNRAIRAEFDGRNQRELARKFGLSTRQVREILRSRAATGNAAPVKRSGF